MNIMIVHHHPCWDGVGAAWVVDRWVHSQLDAELGDEEAHIHRFPTTYGDEPPVINDMDAVYIVDFSFKRDVLEKLHAQFDSDHPYAEFVVLDHHKSAQKELEGLDYCIFDMERSGARMAWDYFFEGTEPPEFIKLIEDRDLWNWEYVDTKPFSLWLRAKECSLETLDRLYGSGEDGYVTRMDDAIVDGEAMLAYQNQMVERIVETAFPVEVVTEKGTAYSVYTVNTSQLHSEVGHELAEEHGVGMTFYYTPDNGVKFSLRGDGSVDVSEIASVFGGGGHHNAAGFCLSETAVERLHIQRRITYEDVTFT